MIDENYLTRVLEELVKKTIKEKIRPAEFLTGTISATEPIKVKIANDLEIPNSALIISDQFKEFTLNTTDNEHTIKYDNRLKVGDKVRLLKNMGGQQFLVYGRIQA